MDIEHTDSQTNRIIIFNLVAVSFVSIILLSLLNNFPLSSILIVDGLFSIFIANTFRKFKFRFLFLLHPLIIWMANQFYVVPFLQLGDGPQIISTFRHYLNTSTLTIDFNRVEGEVYPNLVFGIRQLSLGTIPIILIPEILYGRPASEVYYFWQNTFATILIALCVTMGHLWRATNEKYLLYISLFAVLSPSFVELRSSLNRYDLLFSALFLFYLVFSALNKKVTIFRFAILILALALIIITKYFLLPLVLLFLIYYYVLVKQNNLILLSLGAIILVVAIAQSDWALLTDLIVKQYSISRTGGATFSSTTQIPLVGFLFKYLFALLAPFPWHRILLLTEGSYGGNYFIFFMHCLSSLSGIYLFLFIIIKRKIYEADPELKVLIMFGLIMSLSILLGATGYHSYLLIYFPFLAPIFSLREQRISLWVPICFVVIVEIGYILVRWCVEPQSTTFLEKIL